MSEDATDAPGDLLGLSVEEAVDAVVAGDESRDRNQVRVTLDHVAEDGVVSREGVDEGLSETSMYVSTAETRTELAATEFEDATAAARPVADLDAVDTRLDGFEPRLRSVEARVEELQEDLASVVDRRDDASVLDVASDLQRIAADASEVQWTADELQDDLESFRFWVENPQVRYWEVGEDLDALGEWLDELDDATDRLSGDADGDESADEVDPAVVWFDAELHRRLLALLLADLRAELADLREWAARDGVDHDGEVEGEVDDEERIGELTDRLDDLETRLASAGDRLDERVRPAWRERFADRLAAFDEMLAAYDPPVDWEEVHETFQDHRPTAEDAA